MDQRDTDPWLSLLHEPSVFGWSRAQVRPGFQTCDPSVGSEQSLPACRRADRPGHCDGTCGGSDERPTDGTYRALLSDRPHAPTFSAAWVLCTGPDPDAGICVRPAGRPAADMGALWAGRLASRATRRAAQRLEVAGLVRRPVWIDQGAGAGPGDACAGLRWARVLFHSLVASGRRWERDPPGDDLRQCGGAGHWRPAPRLACGADALWRSRPRSDRRVSAADAALRHAAGPSGDGGRRAAAV